MKELFDKYISTWLIERKQRQFERELNEAFREKKEKSPLLYLLLAFPILCVFFLFFFYESDVEVPPETKKEAQVKPAETIPPKPKKEIVIKAGPKIEKPAPIVKPKPLVKEPVVIPKPVETVKPEPKPELAPIIQPETEVVVEVIPEPEIIVPDVPDVPEVEVIAEKALIYSLESDLADIIAFLDKGSIIELIQEEKGWKKVRYGDRKIGWIKSQDVKSLTGKQLKTIFSEKPEIKEKSSLLLAKEFLDDWIARTEGRDIEAYIQLYDKDFVGRGKDRAAWKERKGRIFKNARFILVGVKKIRIIKEDDKALTVGFVQYYNNSDGLKSTNNKVLLLKKTDKGFRILKEYLQ